jgi:NAD+ kinase
MKIAIYGQYYQNSTEPIIKIFLFFLKQSRIIIANFLEMLYEKKLYKRIQYLLLTYELDKF